MIAAAPPLTLSSHLHQRITLHARRAMPREAAGLVIGTADGIACETVPLTNLVPGTSGFVADPYEQFCALRRIATNGLSLLAIYHSHPGGALTPSVLDVEYGRRWSCSQLVVAVARPDIPDGTCQAFRFDDDCVLPAAVIITEY